MVENEAPPPLLAMAGPAAPRSIKKSVVLWEIHWELGNIPNTGGDALSQMAKNFLKVQNYTCQLECGT